MYNKMELPKYYQFVKTGAAVCLGVACIVGFIALINGFKLFAHGPRLGFMGLASGVLYITGAFIVYGLIDCFLSSVKAQIESRNELANISAALQQKQD